MKSLFLRLFILFYFFVFSNTESAGMVEFEKNGWPEMVRSFQYFEDKAGHEEFPTLENNHTAFRKYEGQKLEQNKIYWLKLSLENSKIEKQNNFIHFNTALGSLNLYQRISNDSIYKSVAGALIAERDRTVGGLYKEKLPFKVSANTTTTLFIRIQDNIHRHYKLNGLDIISLTQYNNTISRNYFIEHFFIGIAIIIVLVNFCLFVFTKDRLYLFYLIYVLITFIYFLHIYQLSERYILYKYPRIDIALYFSLTFSQLVYLCFFYELIKHEPVPRWSRFINQYRKLIGVFSLVIFAVHFARLNTALLLNDIYTLINGTFIIVFFLLLYNKVSKTAKFVLLGSTILVLCGLTVIILNSFNYNPANVHLYQLGVFLEIVLFTIAINHIYSKEKQEKIALAVANSQLIEEKSKRDLENKDLLETIEKNERDIETKTMIILQKESILSGVSEYLSELSDSESISNPKIQERLRTIDLNNKIDNWKEFEYHFTNIHPKFYSQLIEIYPNLTRNEIKLCAFIKLNLSTKEICSITGKSQNTIDVSRSRLRKKIGLNNENLTSFVAAIG